MQLKGLTKTIFQTALFLMFIALGTFKVHAQLELEPEALPSNVEPEEFEVLVKKLEEMLPEDVMQYEENNPDPVLKILDELQEEFKPQFEMVQNLLKEDETGQWSQYQEEMKQLLSDDFPTEEKPALRARMLETYEPFFLRILEQAEIPFDIIKERFQILADNPAYTFNPVFGIRYSHRTPNENQDDYRQEGKNPSESTKHEEKPKKETAPKPPAREDFVFRKRFAYSKHSSDKQGAVQYASSGSSSSRGRGFVDANVGVSGFRGYGRPLGFLGNVIKVPAGVKKVTVRTVFTIKDRGVTDVLGRRGYVKTYRHLLVRGSSGVKRHEKKLIQAAYAFGWQKDELNERESYNTLSTSFTPDPNGDTYIIAVGTIAEASVRTAIGYSKVRASGYLKEIHVTFYR